MDYYFLESQLHKSGYVDGSVTFAPQLATYYSQVHTALPANTVAEVDCFGYERSDYGRKAVIAASVQEPPRKLIKAVFKAYLDAEKVGGREFFMLAHVLALKPIISGEFYEICKMNKLKLNVTAL